MLRGVWRDKLGPSQPPTFIGFDPNGEFIAEAAWLAREFGDRRFSFRVNTQTAQVAAARAGYGVALLPRYLVPPHGGEMAENEMTSARPWMEGAVTVKTCRLAPDGLSRTPR